MIYPDTFNNDRRFIVNNCTNEDFTCQQFAQDITVKKGEQKEFPMATAYHVTKHLVDREMIKAGKESSLASDEARHEYEIQVLAEITGNVDSPALADLKKKIEEEVVENQKSGKIKKAKAPKEKKVESKEFADIK